MSEILAGWEAEIAGLTGAERLERQQELVRQAVAELGGGTDLLKLIEFLRKRGEGDLSQWVIEHGARELFASENAAAAREWLVELDDMKLQEDLCRQAGLAYTGEGFEPYMLRFSDIHSKHSLLTGYCTARAEYDPDGAVDAFFTLRAVAGVDFTGMREILAVVPAGSDFVGLSQRFPDDSKSLAKAARTALFGAWAESEPREAADYILANSSLVHADQLGPVLTPWLERDEVAALGWADSLPAGAHRDAALAAQARHFSTLDPVRAEDAIEGISDPELRMSTRRHFGSP